MLLKRNLLENVTIISCSGTIICVLLNYLTNISPIKGIWFPLYIFLLFLLSVWFSFKFMQWLLHLNKPVKYDLERLITNYPQLSFLSRVLPLTINNMKEKQEWTEYDTNELSVISSVLERKLVSSWYMPYISQEIGFPFACKQMLDQIISKSFQICHQIDMKDVHVDICTILANHLKEYKRAVKRHEDAPTSSIPSLYKKSHPKIGTKYQNADHCIFILRIILKELVPWELWDTPHSELLVRILAKKLDAFIDNTLADPVWLNDRLMSLISKKDCIEDVSEVKNESVQPVKLEPSVEVPPVIKNSPLKITEKTEPMVNAASIVEETVVSSSEPVDVKSSPILRQWRGRQGRNEVKIYDRIIEGAVKTWETDMDLQCISMGQDLLASLDGELRGRLWPDDHDHDHDHDHDQDHDHRQKGHQLWFGEEDIEVEGDLSEAVRKESSPTAGDALLKDLQSTVHHAKARIGGLQVRPLARAPPDEAAGMMEGLLDFGIAGLKKGLRFTGLSDDSQDKSLSYNKERNNDRSPPAEVKGKAIQEHREPVWNKIKEDNEMTIPPLLKQQRVISQDSVPVAMVAGGESPEPQYEEAADLSTSIAKLRCLLEQRSQPREETWWEGAEETRGRLVLNQGPRHVDSATFADEYDMSVERNPSPGQTSNNMQRLDKLFQRTVTGVFNSLKTAVGAEGQASNSSTAPPWTYVCSAHDLGVCGAVSRLVEARRAQSLADAALDPLRATPHSSLPAPDDVEEWCAWCGAGWGSLTGVCAAAGLLSSHVAHRGLTLLLADLAESLITSWLDEFGSWLRSQVFVVFERMAKEDEPDARKATLRPFDIDETCAAVLTKVPLLYTFGEESVSAALKLTLSSFSHKELNKDFILRVFDLLALHFKNSAEASHPTFDNNETYRV